MNFTIFRRFQGGLNYVRQMVAFKNLEANGTRGIHEICGDRLSRQTTAKRDTLTNAGFLTPVSHEFYQCCGMKQRGLVKRYCKDCHFVTRQGRMFVYCKSFSSHKQMQIQKKEKYSRILTFAYQKKVRDW